MCNVKVWTSGCTKTCSWGPSSRSGVNGNGLFLPSSQLHTTICRWLSEKTKVPIDEYSPASENTSIQFVQISASSYDLL